jgi:transposase-like protein
MRRCRVCKARFSERKGTPLFGSHLSEEKAVAILHHLAEGSGVRKTGRLTGVNRGTVASYGKKAGAHAKALHSELVAVSPPDDRSPVR